MILIIKSNMNLSDPKQQTLLKLQNKLKQPMKAASAFNA